MIPPHAAATQGDATPVPLEQKPTPDGSCQVKDGQTLDNELRKNSAGLSEADRQAAQAILQGLNKGDEKAIEKAFQSCPKDQESINRIRDALSATLKPYGITVGVGQAPDATGQSIPVLTFHHDGYDKSITFAPGGGSEVDSVRENNGSFSTLEPLLGQKPMSDTLTDIQKALNKDCDVQAH